jgi:hypothetical protein
MWRFDGRVLKDIFLFQEFKLKLPSSVFESEYREDIGLLNKAATSKGNWQFLS